MQSTEWSAKEPENSYLIEFIGQSKMVVKLNSIQLGIVLGQISGNSSQKVDHFRVDEVQVGVIGSSKIVRTTSISTKKPSLYERQIALDKSGSI